MLTAVSYVHSGIFKLLFLELPLEFWEIYVPSSIVFSAHLSFFIIRIWGCKGYNFQSIICSGRALNMCYLLQLWSWKFISIYRYSSFYCASLYHASKILYFLQIECLWQPYVGQVYQHHFSNSIWSLLVSVPHFRDSHNI